jgi:arylsulfatase
LIVHWPKGLEVEPGAITHQPGHLIDIMPTLLEVAGGQYPDSFDGREIRPVEGRSLLPLLKGNQHEAHDWLFFNFAGKNRAIQVGDWKLVSAERGRWELYNLARDRNERDNRIESKAALGEALRKFWHLTADRVARLPAGQRRPVRDQPPSISPGWVTDRE